MWLALGCRTALYRVLRCDSQGNTVTALWQFYGGDLFLISLDGAYSMLTLKISTTLARTRMRCLIMEEQLTHMRSLRKLMRSQLLEAKMKANARRSNLPGRSRYRTETT